MSESRSPSIRLWKIDVQDLASEVLVCTSCGEAVTCDRYRVRVAGAHQHDFFNPQRVHHAIACFSSANGCRVVGKQANRFTWFDGYAWATALCRRCGTHLGWRFISAGGGHLFFGLVKSRLVRLGQGFAN